MFISVQFWMLLALGSGLCGIAVDVLRKSILTTSVDNQLVIMFRFFACAVPFAVIWWLIAGRDSSVSNPIIFWCALLVGIVCEIIAQRHYQIAVKALPLAVCRPMMEMTMIVMIPLSYLLLKMPINLHSLGAILIFLCGILIINSEGEASWIQNIWQRLRSTEMRSIGFVVLFWSMTTVLQKVCLVYTNPAFFTLCLLLGLIIGIVPLLCINSISWKEVVGKELDIRYLVGGALSTLMAGLQFTSLSHPDAHPSIVIVLKRTAQLLYVFIDQSFFQTRITFARVLGNLLAFAGVVVIAL